MTSQFRQEAPGKPDVARWRNEGVKHHRRGELDSAWSCYLRVLESSPDDAEGLYQMGLLCFERRAYELARHMLDRSLTLRPDDAECLNALGNVHQMQQELPQACACYQQALVADPQFADAFNNLGATLHALGDSAKALVCIRTALELRPLYAEARFNAGAILQPLGYLKEAAEAYQSALRVEPTCARAATALASLYREQGDLPAAIRTLEAAAAHDPQQLDIWLELGQDYLSVKRYEDAVACSDQILHYHSMNPQALCLGGYGRLCLSQTEDAIVQLSNAVAGDPDLLSARFHLAEALMRNNRYEEAGPHLERVVQQHPDHARALNALGCVFQHLDELESSEHCLRRAMDLSPDLPGLQTNLGVVLTRQQRPQEAVAAFDRALLSKPHCHKTRMGRGMALLADGRYYEGWSDYEHRLSLQQSARCSEIPMWSGEQPWPRRLLVYGEQGVGTEMMFASCLPDLVQSVQHCVVRCDPRLVPLLQRSFPQALIVSRDTPEEPLRAQCDGQVAIGSLPRLFRPTASSFPPRRAYLQADPLLQLRWRHRLAELGHTLKVGISWRGGRQASPRKLDSAIFQQLCEVGGVDWISVQYGASRQELEQLAPDQHQRITSWDELDPFLDLDNLAAFICELDLVISICNSTVHLAGAVGTDVCCLVPHRSDWRWPVGHDASLWHPSVRLMRQPPSGDWTELTERLRSQLYQRLALRHRRAG